MRTTKSTATHPICILSVLTVVKLGPIYLESRVSSTPANDFNTCLLELGGKGFKSGQGVFNGFKTHTVCKPEITRTAEPFTRHQKQVVFQRSFYEFYVIVNKCPGEEVKGSLSLSV